MKRHRYIILPREKVGYAVPTFTKFLFNYTPEYDKPIELMWFFDIFLYSAKSPAVPIMHEQSVLLSQN